MSGTTHYRIYVHPIPLLPSNDDQTSNIGDHNNARGDVLDVVTGIFEEYSKHLISLLATQVCFITVALCYSGYGVETVPGFALHKHAYAIYCDIHNL